LDWIFVLACSTVKVYVFGEFEQKNRRQGKDGVGFYCGGKEENGGRRGKSGNLRRR